MTLVDNQKSKRATRRALRRCAITMAGVLMSQVMDMPVTRADSAQQASEAAADDETRPPWAKGVPLDHQEKALKLAESGLSLLQMGAPGSAATLFRRAIRYWDHPGIHYQLMLALGAVDDRVGAHAAAIAALRYEAASLTAEQAEHARTQRGKLRSKLVEIELSCQQSDITVTLDGRVFVMCPGTTRELVEAGLSQIVARGPGYVTKSRTVHLRPGGTVQSIIHLQVETTRRFAAWKPWAVVGSGALLAALAGGFQASANDHAEHAHQLLDLHCPNGCTIAEFPADLRAAVNRFDRRRSVAIGMYLGAGAIIATSVALLFINRPRPVRKRQTTREGLNLSLTPMSGGFTAQLSVPIK